MVAGECLERLPLKWMTISRVLISCNSLTRECSSTELCGLHVEFVTLFHFEGGWYEFSTVGVNPVIASNSVELSRTGRTLFHGCYTATAPWLTASSSRSIGIAAMRHLVQKKWSTSFINALKYHYERQKRIWIPSWSISQHQPCPASSCRLQGP